MPKLSLRSKVLISLTIFIFLFLGLAIFVSQKIFLDSFFELENREAVKSIERSKIVFDRQILNMDVKLADWAIWDDSYYFVQDKNQDYIDSNLTEQSLYNLQINGMFFIASSGAVVYEKQININTKQNASVLNELKNTLLKSKNIIFFKDIKDRHSGVIQSSSGPVLFASRPILKSDATGPIAGTLIFIRYYDKQIKEYLENVNNNNEVDILNHDSIPNEYVKVKEQLDSGKKYYAFPLSSDKIGSFTHIYDYNKKAVYILENELPRVIYKQGFASILNFLYFIVVLSVSGITLVLFLINKLVISKITKLNKDVSLVNDPNNPKHKLDVVGTDEFAALSSNINKMLDDITKSQENLKKTNEELGVEKANLNQKVEELEKFNKLTVGRELMMIELKKKITELENNK